MKTTKLILIFCLIIPFIAPAQIRMNLKPDSLLSPDYSYSISQKDSLKLNLQSGENQFRFPRLKYMPSIPNRNLAFAPPNGQSKAYSNKGMPVYNPEFKSNMPVMIPDTSVHFYLRIAKIRNLAPTPYKSGIR